MMAKPIKSSTIPLSNDSVFNNASYKSFFAVKITKYWWMKENHSFCQTKYVCKHYISRYKQQKWTLKNCLANKFTKTTVTIRFNLFRVFPSVSTFVLAVSFILSSNFLSAYFNISLCLAADASVGILINLVTQFLSYGQWTVVSCPIKRFVINCVLWWTLPFWR